MWAVYEINQLQGLKLPHFNSALVVGLCERDLQVLKYQHFPRLNMDLEALFFALLIFIIGHVLGSALGVQNQSSSIKTHKAQLLTLKDIQPRGRGIHTTSGGEYHGVLEQGACPGPGRVG